MTRTRPRSILLTGGSGQVGTALRELAPAGWEISAPSSKELNLGDADSVTAALEGRSWDAVVNAGAYTAVDRAEQEVGAAWRINAMGAAVLARAAALAGSPIVHLSTDYVFDGTKPESYFESDAVAPINVYGASKLAGEFGVSNGNPRHVILRSAWIVSGTGSNFVKTMLKLGAERPEVRVVADQRGCPTSAADLAVAVAAVVDRLVADNDAPTGIYHFVNQGSASWHELAESIFAMGRELGLKTPELHAIPSADYPTPARRPSNSVLETGKIMKDYGIVARPWAIAIQDVVKQLAASAVGVP